MDGSIHDVEEVAQNDATRHKQLEADGLTVVRFTNDNVRLRSEQVIQQIEAILSSKAKPKKVKTH